MVEYVRFNLGFRAPIAARWQVLVILTAILTFNYIDRVALGLLTEDIRLSLRLTDTQLGFISGIAFAFFYSVLGLPIARWADRGNRVAIIAITCITWSIGVAACGLAKSFTALALYRVIVASGEAGCIPPAFSVIGDLFSRTERPRAVAIYGLGGGIACVIGYLAAGWLDARYGWRVTFELLAIPGPCLCLMLLLAVREPRRSQATAGDAMSADGETPVSVREIACSLLRSQSFILLVVCLSSYNFLGYAILQWQGVFYIRSHSLSSEQVGLYLAVAVGTATILGTLLAGEVCSRVARNDEAKQLRIMSVCLALSGPCLMASFIVDSVWQSLCWLFLSALLQGTINGPLFSTVQTIVRANMRAVAFAVLYLISNLVGMGFGPLAAGMLSDTLSHTYHNEALRHALLILSPGFLIVGLASWKASSHVSSEVGLKFVQVR